VSRPHLILLGYEVGVGEGVTIPLGHMAVTGQTQQAGKTTTLEALAHRAGRPVLAFVTKRGEGAFGAAPGHSVRSVQPYFRERADWQFVEAVLEATMRERMKYERQWIMKVSRGAENLGDVRFNTQQALDAARGEFMKSTYEKLLAYLDIVVPQLRQITWAKAIDLRTGLNVMYLGEMSSELQALVIASCLDFVMATMKDVIVIVPEAWEFIPRGRKSPVTLSAESYVRKGAALRNYLWIDSQDLAGVHTPVLKQTQVFLLGVQREINEIKRTIAHLHGPAKPKPDAIARLGLGQFIACWGSSATPTYVMPWWMDERDARAFALGDDHVLIKPQPPKEDPMDTQLREENERLKQEVADLRAALNSATVRMDRMATQYGAPAPPTAAVDLARESVRPGPSGNGGLPGTYEEVYAHIRNMLLADGQMLAAVAKVQASRPEIVIELRPRMISYDGSSAKGRIAKMIADGLLDEPCKPGVIIKEFKRTGGEIHPSRLSNYLSEFVSDGMLIRDDGLYQKAPGLKVTKTELQALV